MLAGGVLPGVALGLWLFALPVTLGTLVGAAVVALRFLGGAFGLALLGDRAGLAGLVDRALEVLARAEAG